MPNVIIRFIALFCSALAAAFLAALGTPQPYTVWGVITAYVLTSAVMYWLLDLDNVKGDGL